jgi:putative transposase
MYREHSEIDTTPFLKWNADNFIPRLPDSLEGLDLLLLTVKKKRSVRTDGIHFDGMRYINLALANIVGYDVVVRYDPRDLSELKVYLNDQFLCTAVCEGETARSANIKDIATARNRRRKILGRAINARAELVKLYLQSAPGERKIEDGYESPSSPCDTIQPQRPSGLKLYAADFAAAKARGRTVPENG